ncbi:MAG: hypothetical protein EOM31_14190 [Bacteroidia bacterium]|nr:hypothetical protein [Bacteroidia bacterium]
MTIIDMPIVRLIACVIGLVGAVGLAVDEIAKGDVEKMVDIYGNLLVVSLIILLVSVIFGGVINGL